MAMVKSNAQLEDVNNHAMPTKPFIYLQVNSYERGVGGDKQYVISSCKGSSKIRWMQLKRKKWNVKKLNIILNINK